MASCSSGCPLHKLPYDYVIFRPGEKNFLRCKECPFDPTCQNISDEVSFMKSRMGSHKSEQREKERQQRARSKSGKEKKLSQKEQEDLDEIVQKIAE